MIDFVVVKEVGNDFGDLSGGRAGGDVLAVTAAVGGDIVGVDAGGTDLGGGVGEGGGPGEARRGVVGAVDVVVGDY